MLASLDFVKILHNCHKMDEDLDLIEEVYIDVNSENMENMEDGEKGRPGTNKRRRAYEIKVSVCNVKERSEITNIQYKFIHFRIATVVFYLTGLPNEVGLPDEYNPKFVFVFFTL